METKTILSLCDYSGEWPRPYEQNGYRVVLLDVKFSRWHDIRMVTTEALMDMYSPIYGILAAPPCHDFTNASARLWPNKDRDGRTLRSLHLVDACMRIIHVIKPHFWALENPPGRLRRWLGEPTYTFQPYWFGDPWSKKTHLWGEFNPPEKTNVVEPTDDWFNKLGGDNERTKEIRSLTPPGFAQAFYEANHE